MIFTIIHYLRGFLELRLTGIYIERFLNLCVRKGIFLWCIRKETATEATARVSIPGFFRMREAARKTKTRIRILRKRGLPLFLHRHRRRGAFWAGMLLFVLIIALLSSFVWSVEIDGTEKIDKNVIRNALRSCGLDVGVLKYTVKASEIKEDMLREVPELTWLWVEIRGTRALVHVREKTPAPEMIPEDRPCNIVAKKDGVITEYVAERGTMLAQEGDVIQKGALLISGTVETNLGGTLLVHAKGSVKARTWYTASDIFPLSMQTEADSGESHTRFKLHFGQFTLPLHKKDAPYETYRTDVKTHRLHLFGEVYFPISVEEHTLHKTNQNTIPLSPEEAVSHYGKTLFSSLQLPEGVTVINTEYTHILHSDGNIFITCTVECVEEIGETREILEGTSDDREIF